LVHPAPDLDLIEPAEGDGRHQWRTFASKSRLQAPYEEAFERLGDPPATTPTGIRAKAEAVAVAAYYEEVPPDRGVAGAALWSLVLDLTGHGAESKRPACAV